MARVLPFGSQVDIIVIRTDDGPWDSWQAEAMPLFVINFVPTSISCDRAIDTMALCCPSRCAGLSGLSTDRHGVADNTSGGVFLTYNTFLWACRGVGYYVGTIGKYMNPDSGNVTVFAQNDTLGCDYKKVYNGDPDYYDYDRFEATSFGPATNVHYGSDAGHGGADANYAGRHENADVLDFYTRAVASGKPICLYWAPKACHVGGGQSAAIPDPAYLALSVSAKDDVSYGLDPAQYGCPQKMIDGAITPWDTAAEALTRSHHKDAIRTLRGFDDGLDGLRQAVVAAGRMAQTLWIFTTDNAHSYGEFRQEGKGTNHISSASPLMWIRLPSGTPGTRLQPFADYDLAPTVCHAAGARMPIAPDGHSMINALLNNACPHTEGAYLTNRVKNSPRYFGFATSLYSAAQGINAASAGVNGTYTSERWCWSYADRMCALGTTPNEAIAKAEKIRAWNRLTRVI